MQQRHTILAIETSCDETGIALVEASGGLRAPRFRVVRNLIASQIPVHRPFGGVVPNLAKREHQKNLPILLAKLKAKSSKLKAIDLIAVTVGPGLEPALWTGIEFAKELYKKLKTENKKLRLVGANHLEGHLYSFLLPQKVRGSKFDVRMKTSRTSNFSNNSNMFPAIALLVSGGHTILLLMESLTKWKKLGETRDDAAGEAFDKVGRLLGLPYPGGPEIERIAKKGNPAAIAFPRPMINQKNYDFSFAGLKTSVLYYLRDQNLKAKSSKLKANVAASFQAAAIDVLVHKTMRAAAEFNARSVILCGGVAANRALRRTLKAKSSKLKARFFVPPMTYNTDNAAMIAAAAYMNHLTGKKYRLAARGDMTI